MGEPRKPLDPGISWDPLYIISAMASLASGESKHAEDPIRAEARAFAASYPGGNRGSGPELDVGFAVVATADIDERGVDDATGRDVRVRVPAKTRGVVKRVDRKAPRFFVNWAGDLPSCWTGQVESAPLETGVYVRAVKEFLHQKSRTDPVPMGAVGLIYQPHKLMRAVTCAIALENVLRINVGTLVHSLPVATCRPTSRCHLSYIGCRYANSGARGACSARAGVTILLFFGPLLFL